VFESAAAVNFNFEANAAERLLSLMIIDGKPVLETDTSILKKLCCCSGTRSVVVASQREGKTTADADSKYI
jgi:hypothetical protein